MRVLCVCVTERNSRIVCLRLPCCSVLKRVDYLPCGTYSSLPACRHRARLHNNNDEEKTEQSMDVTNDQSDIMNQSSGPVLFHEVLDCLDGSQKQEGVSIAFYLICVLQKFPFKKSEWSLILEDMELSASDRVSSALTQDLVVCRLWWWGIMKSSSPCCKEEKQKNIHLSICSKNVFHLANWSISNCFCE